MIVRDLAGWDVDTARRVVKWPLREALFSYVALLKERAGRDYRHSMLVWASATAFAAKRPAPPKPPDILKE